MNSLAHLLWFAAALIACVATIPGEIELLLLTIGACLPRRDRRERTYPVRRVAVIVPAHNEEHGIARTVASLRACIPSNRDVVILVVADNCSDNTAVIAAKAGASVLERKDPDKRGKGYALDYAFCALAREDFDVFLVIDADSTVAPDFIDVLCTEFEKGASAVQCRYLVANPNSSLRTRLMNMALLAFNVLRPRGRARWGLSAGILGNGFGLSARTLARVPYRATSVVEDLEYHLSLIRAGNSVRFADHTAVYGEMPAEGRGVRTQRTRWEGGRFRMIATVGPHLAMEIAKGQWRLLEPLLELLLLPLALHVSLLLVALAGPGFLFRVYGIAGLLSVAVHVIAAALLGGAGWRGLAILAVAPFYVVWKLLMLPAALRASRADWGWVRTERQTERQVER